MRTLGLKLFEPRQYALRISAFFYQRDEVLYRAFDFAKAPGPPACSTTALSPKSCANMRMSGSD